MKDYYELLEVNKNASDDTIKKVFRMLIKKNHPDLFEGKEKAKAEKKVKELNEAYEVLRDKEKREKYNSELDEKKLNTDIKIETLIQENEYLKSVIQEKDNMIKECLEELGIDTSKIPTSKLFDDNLNSEEKMKTEQNIQSEAYRLYLSKQRMEKIIYTILMILGGIIVLKIFTGVNILKIFIDVLRTMF